MTMQRLLTITAKPPAADADQTTDLPQIHAFNVLRAIFLDAKMGSEALSYVEDAFVLAINGFSSASWAVRNCSLLLFSAILLRALGSKKTRDEHDAVNSLTGREFFAQYPRLHPFLLQELEKAVRQLLEPSEVGFLVLGPLLQNETASELLCRSQKFTQDSIRS